MADEDPEGYERAVGKLQEYRRQQLEARTPIEVYNDYQANINKGTMELAAQLETLDKAQSEAEAAQARVQQIDLVVNDLFSNLEALYQQRDAAKAKVPPPCRREHKSNRRRRRRGSSASTLIPSSSGPPRTGSSSR
jgi:chromosome segregation ATPase